MDVTRPTKTQSHQLYEFDSRMKCTYFIETIEPSIFLVVIFNDKKRKNDTATQDFLSYLRNSLTMVPIFQALSHNWMTGSNSLQKLFDHTRLHLRWIINTTQIYKRFGTVSAGTARIVGVWSTAVILAASIASMTCLCARTPSNCIKGLLKPKKKKK